MGARLLVTAATRAAARHTRGVVPLMCVSQEHFLLVRYCLPARKWVTEANLPWDADGAIQNPDISQVGLSGIAA